MVTEELDHASTLVFQSSGSLRKFVNTVVTPVLLNSAMASSTYLSKSVSKIPWYMKCADRSDIEQHPAQVVELQGRENLRIRLHRLLDRLAVVANGLLPPGFHLGDDREAVLAGVIG